MSELLDAFRITTVVCFSPRVREVLLMTGEGLSSQEIADRMEISEQTVKNHLTHIYETMTLRGVLRNEHSPRSRVAYLLGVADGVNLARDTEGMIFKVVKPKQIRRVPH